MNLSTSSHEGDPGLRLYLEDLVPGLHFTSSAHELDRSQIVDFASRFDPQPFHLDEEAAKNSLFGGLVASGWHTAALTMKLLIAGGIIGAEGEISWKKPVRPMDVLRVRSEIADVKPSKSRPERGIVTVRSETINQRNEVVQSFTMKLIVFRRLPTVPASTCEHASRINLGTKQLSGNLASKSQGSRKVVIDSFVADGRVPWNMNSASLDLSRTVRRHMR